MCLFLDVARLCTVADAGWLGASKIVPHPAYVQAALAPSLLKRQEAFRKSCELFEKQAQNNYHAWARNRADEQASNGEGEDGGSNQADSEKEDYGDSNDIDILNPEPTTYVRPPIVSLKHFSSSSSSSSSSDVAGYNSQAGSAPLFALGMLDTPRPIQTSSTSFSGIQAQEPTMLSSLKRSSPGATKPRKEASDLSQISDTSLASSQRLEDKSDEDPEPQRKKPKKSGAQFPQYKPAKPYVPNNFKVFPGKRPPNPEEEAERDKDFDYVEPSENQIFLTQSTGKKLILIL